ncbi:hypothetical protein NSS79_15425 [Paenibacillus sp. FSL L8-0436]|uniref:hypothetical protein n=1 Tax=Paenibacillus sp. FSL L8-0436 TaxID=2954686 RepID=UPI00315855A8
MSETDEQVQKEEQAAQNEKDLAASEKAGERQVARQESALMKQLAKMKKVKITIPDDPLNPDDVVPVGWNGIIYAIPRGQEFEVPEVIYDIWKESYTKTQAVNKRVRENANREIKIL